ncbi:uncharacterized protein PG998_014855 [Apiospora kogelbergensis]|uniref:uncharacterized protein n=1 Tax=Apiospora kogelbergensis TaxID=1337665 RepID=UPI00312D2C41
MLTRIVILFVGIAAALPGMQLVATPRANAAISPMYWRGQIEAGGPEMTFNGTIQEVVAQIRKIKPDFPSGLEIPTSGPQAKDDDPHEVDCWVGGGGPATVIYIKQGIQYLRSIPGNCGVSAGDQGYNTCARISCSYDSGIWLCSDQGQEVLWPCSSLGDIADNDCFKCWKGEDSPEGVCQGREKWPEQAGGFHVDIGVADC